MRSVCTKMANVKPSPAGKGDRLRWMRRKREKIALCQDSPHPSAYAATSTFCLQNSTRRLRHSPRWGRLLVSLFRTRSPHNAATILRTNHIKPVGTGVLDGPFRTCNFYLINGYDIIYSTDALCKLKGIATLDRRGRRSLQKR